MIARYLLCTIALAGIGVISGCGGGELVAVPLEPTYRHIEDPEERWRAYGLRNYIVTQLHSCGECIHPGEFDLVVKRDKPADVICNSPKTPSSLDCSKMDPGGFLTVDDLFAQIEEWKARDPHLLVVEYHEEFGFPTYIEVDFYSDMADDEKTYTVWNFRALK